MLKLPSGENSPQPYLLTLIPPLILSLLDPEIFFKALDFAGTYGGKYLFSCYHIKMFCNTCGNDVLSVVMQCWYYSESFRQLCVGLIGTQIRPQQLNYRNLFLEEGLHFLLSWEVLDISLFQNYSTRFISSDTWGRYHDPHINKDGVGFIDKTNTFTYFNIVMLWNTYRVYGVSNGSWYWLKTKHNP